MRLLFATTNAGKLAELRDLVKGLALEVASSESFPPFEVEESGGTLEENARFKALAWAERFHLPALADDTGLSVDALGGAPGVHSARYSGDNFPDAASRYRSNNAKLRRELAKVPAAERGAEFRCALCLAVPGCAPAVVRGVCRGRIGFAARGENGFGYDPLFELPEKGKTLSELEPEEKNQLSHRARAFEAMRPHLEALANLGVP